MINYLSGYVPTLANWVHNGDDAVLDIGDEIKKYSDESGLDAVKAFRSFFKLIQEHLPLGEYHTLAGTIYYSSILGIIKDQTWNGRGNFQTDSQMIESVVNTFAKQHLLDILDSLSKPDADIPIIRQQFISRVLNAVQTNTWTGQFALMAMRQFQELEMVTKPTEALMSVIHTVYQAKSNDEIDNAYGKLIKGKIDTYVVGLENPILTALFTEYKQIFHGLVDSSLALALDADTLEEGQVHVRVQELLEGLGKDGNAADLISQVMQDKFSAHLDSEAFEFVKGLLLRFATTPLQNAMDTMRNDQTVHAENLAVRAVTAKAGLQSALGMDVEPKVNELFEKVKNLQAAALLRPLFNMRDAEGNPYIEPLFKNLLMVAVYEIMNSCEEPKLQSMLDKFCTLATRYGTGLRDAETRPEKVQALRRILVGMLGSQENLYLLLPEIVRSRIGMPKLLDLTAEALLDMLGPVIVAIAEADSTDVRVEALENAMDGALEILPIEPALKVLFKSLHGTAMRTKIDAILLNALDEGALVDAAKKIEYIVKKIYAVDMEPYLEVLHEIDEANKAATENPVLDAIVDQIINKLGVYSGAARIKADLMKGVLRGALAKLGSNPAEKIFDAVMNSNSADDAARKLLPESFEIVLPYVTKYLDPYYENAQKLHLLAEQFRAVGKASPLHALFGDAIKGVIIREAHNQAVLAGTNLTDILDNISFEEAAEFTVDEEVAMANFMQPFVDQKLAANPQLVEDALSVIFSLLVQGNNSDTTAGEELNSLLSFVMPKLTAMFGSHGDEIEAVNLVFKGNSPEDFIAAYQNQVDALSWSRMQHLEGAAKAKKVKDCVLRAVMKEDIKTLLSELLHEKVRPQVDEELFVFLKSNVLRASGVAVLGNLVVHLAEDMKYHDASLKEKAEAGKLLARNFEGLEEKIQVVASMEVRLNDPIIAAFYGARAIENPFAGDQFGVAFQENFAWALMGLVLGKEKPIEGAYVALENAYNKLRLKDLGVEIDSKVVIKEFIDEVLGFEEFEALLPQVARDNNVLDALLTQFSGKFELLVKDLHRSNNRLNITDFDRQAAELIGMPFAAGAIHTALKDANFMRNPKLIGALFSSLNGGKLEGDLDLHALTTNVISSLFPNGLPVSEPGLKGIATEQLEAQLKALFARLETPEMRKAFVAEKLGIQGDIVEGLKDKTSAEIAKLVPGWMDNILFYILFWPLIALVSWGIEYKATVAGEKLVEILERDDFQLMLASVIEAVIANKEGSEEDAWNLLGEFGVPGFTGYFVSLERSLEELAQQHLLQS